MGKNKTAIIILVGALVLVVAVYLWYSNIEKPKYNWYQTFKNDSKEPYGTFVISEMLEKYFPSNKFTVVRKSLSESLPKRSKGMNYVFIGSGMFLDSLGETELLEFVKRGNNAFISVPSFPYIIEDTLNLNICEYYYAVDYYVDSIVNLNFYNKEFKKESAYPFKYRYINESVSYSWSYLKDSCINPDSKVVYYGNINDTFPDYARIAFGNGYFFIHTSPLAFTNFQMLNKSAVEYASKVFSYLPEGDIYWDEFSKIPPQFDEEAGGKLNWQKSPLYFILSQPALKTAWYIIIALVLLYILFRAKRRQRVIPILNPNTNTSLEFAETIGRIYYLQNDHKKLASQKMKLFLESIRNRYNISTTNIDEVFFQKLSQKSQVPQNEIEKLFANFKAIEYLKEISENLLISFNQSIDNFNKKAR